GHGMVDAQIGGVAPPSAVDTGGRFLGDFIAERIPAAQAEAIRAPEPAGARQHTSARTRPGAAGWGVQSKRACAPMAPPAAHSMCGQSARGAEWTKSTPCVISICASYLGYVFPYDPKGGADH